MNRKLKVFSEIMWIIVAAMIGIFFIIAISVYYSVKANGISDTVTEGYRYDGYTDIMNTLGDLEELPYVTRVYSFRTNNEVLNIDYTKKQGGCDLRYGVAEDSSAEYNYTVECFVYSNIANKRWVKDNWNMVATGGECLKLEQVGNFPDLDLRDSMGDIKKEYNMWITYYTYNTFLRITVKPGFDKINFTTMESV